MHTEKYNFSILILFFQIEPKNMACFWSSLMIAVKTCYQILIKFSRIFWLELYSWHIWSQPRLVARGNGNKFPCCFYCIIVLWWTTQWVKLQFEVSFDQLGRYLQCTDDHDHNSITRVSWQMYSYERFDWRIDRLSVTKIRKVTIED